MRPRAVLWLINIALVVWYVHTLGLVLLGY